jgi:hypothetical protein
MEIIVDEKKFRFLVVLGGELAAACLDNLLLVHMDRILVRTCETLIGSRALQTLAFLTHRRLTAERRKYTAESERTTA